MSKATKRVLVVSHTYFPSDYRGKLRGLAANPELSIRLAAIPSMPTATGTLAFANSPDDRYPIHLLDSIFTGHNVLRTYHFSALNRILTDFKPDLVHVEAEPHAISLFQFVLLRAFHRYRLSFFTWENIYRPTRRPLQPIERVNLRSSDAAIAGNKEAVEVLRKRGFHGAIWVIPQVGIDPGHWTTVEPVHSIARLRERGPVIGFVGRLVREKGVEDLLLAFSTLPKRFSAQLVFVGDGDLSARLRVRAGALRLADRVHFAGAVPYGDVAAFVKAFDLLVVPSRTTALWKEQFGHVIVEAMAAGIPVVGSNSGAIPEVIGDAGLIVPEGDRRALAQVIEALLEDPGRLSRMGDLGRERAAFEFSDRVVASKTADAFSAILA